MENTLKELNRWLRAEEVAKKKVASLKVNLKTEMDNINQKDTEGFGVKAYYKKGSLRCNLLPEFKEQALASGYAIEIETKPAFVVQLKKEKKKK